MIPINWSAIRPLSGSQASGFEELCAQLARADYPNGFIRKGSPDAGVECYAVLPDGSEIAWQAKYFEELGNSQWAQLDKSVRCALNKHPKLSRYVVCVSCDRPDARLGRQTSALQKWDDHVAKWQGWAQSRGMAVEFIFQGSSELIEALHQARHAGRVRFWFDVAAFDDSWFRVRIKESLLAAGPRYTPELNVKLKVAEKFEALTRTPDFFDSIKHLAIDLRKRSRDLRIAAIPPTDELRDALQQLELTLDSILERFGAITVEPVGPLPLSAIVAEITEAEGHCETIVGVLDKQVDEDREGDTRHDRGYSVPGRPKTSREQREVVWRLIGELSRKREALSRAIALAESDLLILTGRAGTGKTHLLCDIAFHRLAQGRPTILLMGQRFLTSDDPWKQALQHLDLFASSAEEFVGALEAAAQAANCRALVIVDAVNEGSGRTLWPSHLAAFLARLERSPWISTVLSVRTSYEEVVIPEAILARAASVVHEGFVGSEYDVLRAFFTHFDIELPSSPPLNPEFSNPLFLKTLCQGLKDGGHRRLPRGYQGISTIFDLYLGAIHKVLASRLNFGVHKLLVRQALDLLSLEFVQSGSHWCSLARAEEIVNSLLPGREFDQSLYHGMVSEGLLVQDIRWTPKDEKEEVTYFGYERLADHLVVHALLDTHVNPDDPAAAFEPSGGMGFLLDEKVYTSSGVFEALCIQVPERFGCELVRLQPKLAKRRGLGDAFRQSIIWRETGAFSDETLDVMNEMIRTDQGWHDTLETLLTVATIPDHPFNATFLHGWLSEKTMPERDAAWSIYLSQAWGNGEGAVYRIVDWASSARPNLPLDDDFLSLCVTTLAWMLTTSNRFLRDRATKALVSVLSGRAKTVVKLIRRFASVEDPYVAERVNAVAYGVAMRTNDRTEAGLIAEAVYEKVFKKDPPAHILLRDYARGVCERAAYLGHEGGVEMSKVRPPYKSVWPTIPTDEDIAKLKADWQRTSYDGGDPEWSRDRIAYSVEGDDFARYVIGTNNGSVNWLSVKMDEGAWMSPERRLDHLISNFSATEAEAWRTYNDGFADAPKKLSNEDLTWLVGKIRERQALDGEDGDHTPIDFTERPLAAEYVAEQEYLHSALEAALTDEHRREWESIEKEKAGQDRGRAPRFDLRIIQRYVLWRVFDLGWTTEKFGAFDRMEIGYHGRDSRKAERIGKKYQWIAYHEILALVADHYQYLEQFREDDGDTSYLGPWQDGIRDLDPSCTLRSIPGGTSWDSHALAWWANEAYTSWDKPESPGKWAANQDDIPNLIPCLVSERPTDGTRWINLHTFLNWEQPVPADHERLDIERRSIWIMCTAYVMQATDAEAFMKWAEGVHFWGRWMPDPPDVWRVYFGEHPWSPAAQHMAQPYDGFDGWTRPRHDCPVDVRLTCFKYLQEAAGFDCSVDDSYSLHIPDEHLMTVLGLRWSGQDAEFIDSHGCLAAFDPTVNEPGPSALLMREDFLRAALAREGLAICWAVVGERRALAPGFGDERHPALEISGAYMLSEGGITGFLKNRLDTEEDTD